MLWEFAEEKASFDFKTIEDILEENQAFQKENDCLNGIIQGKLAEMEALLNTTLTNVNQVWHVEIELNSDWAFAQTRFKQGF